MINDGDNEVFLKAEKNWKNSFNQVFMFSKPWHRVLQSVTNQHNDDALNQIINNPP